MYKTQEIKMPFQMKSFIVGGWVGDVGGVGGWVNDVYHSMASSTGITYPI